MEQYYTPKQAAERMAVSISSIYNYIRAGQLVASRTPSKRIRISESAIQEFFTRSAPRG